ncbi:MAG TPA: ABC transporter transmembrane domain-containing protein, partial [Pyrinomonadaceae bacterium]
MKTKTYKRLLGYALRQWLTLAVIIGLTVANSAIAVLQPWPMKILVDHALNNAPVPTLITSSLHFFSLIPSPVVLIIVAALSSLFLFVLNSVFDSGLTLAWTAASQRMIYDLAGDLFSRLQRLSLLFHSRRTIGDSLSRLTGDTWCVYGLVASVLIAPFQHLLTLTIVSAVAWSLDPAMTLLSLAVAPALGGSALFFAPRLKRRAKQNREAQSHLLSFVHQTLMAIPVVQAFGREELNARQFTLLAEDAVKRSQRGAVLVRSQGLFNGFTKTVANAFVLFVGGQRVLSGGLTVGGLLVFLVYFRSLQNSMQGLFETYTNLKSIEASSDRVMDDLEAEEHVRESATARPLPECCRGERGHVRFDCVDFGYEPGRPVLHDVSLEARPG